MHGDGVNRSSASNDIRRHHFGASAMLRLGGEHKSTIVGVVRVTFVIVVVDPRGQTRSQPVDERSVMVSKDELPASAAKAMSSTTTRPASFSALVSARGVRNAKRIAASLSGLFIDCGKNSRAGRVGLGTSESSLTAKPKASRVERNWRRSAGRSDSRTFA